MTAVSVATRTTSAATRSASHARDLAEPIVTLPDADIAVGYDTDGGTNVDLACTGAVNPDDIDRYDRVIVTVTYDYSPITPI